VPPDEAEAYKKWLLQIGEKVAEAAKEHGVVVSDPEKAALDEIAGALGLPA
jgi:uroporphyrinogen-III synthase